MQYLTKKSSPILLLHGNADNTLNYQNSTYIMEVVYQKGADGYLLQLLTGNMVCAERANKHSQV
jgi:hypothetical protein